MHACIGEGNGNPFQCSCPENPRDRGAWWAVVCGVTQSRTRLKRLSSSSIIIVSYYKIMAIIPCAIGSSGLFSVALSCPEDQVIFLSHSFSSGRTLSIPI